MTQYAKYIILIFLAGISQVTCVAQDSLSCYLEQALLNNPGVKAKYLEYSAALEKVAQAASLPDPDMQFGYFIKPMELIGGNQVADIRLMQMFPWFGTLKAAKDEASKMAVAKFENFRDARNELSYKVKASYYSVYHTEKEIGIAKKNLDILHSLERLATAKFSNGDISYASSGAMGGAMEGKRKVGMVNLLRIQMEINELENKIALLQDQFVTAKVGFNRLLNCAPLSGVFLVDTLAEMPIPSDILALTDSLVNNPVIKMFEAESDANTAKIAMATHMGYPMVGLGLDYMVIQKREGNTSMMNGNDMTMPMISVTLPVYRRKYKSMRQEAELMSKAATLSAENEKNDLMVDFQQTIQNINDAGRRAKLYTDLAMLADKSVQLLITSFSVNGNDLEEVLRMEQQLLDYQFRQVEAVIDKNTAIARLAYLTGN